jgi:cytidylate kinase
MKSDNGTAPVIAIDGPSGAGKGTIARLLAEQLGWHLLDSGALYRLLALACLRGGTDPSDEVAVARLAANLDVRFGVDPEGRERIYLNGQEVSREIRTEDCGEAASRVAPLPAARLALVELQRRFRQAPGLVADGRDMGTVIFPEAPLKLFLTASPAERAQRRHKQLKEKGIDANLAQLEISIAGRDDRDMNRSQSPLRPADDAVQMDTTGVPVDEVLSRVLALVRERLGME